MRTEDLFMKLAIPNHLRAGLLGRWRKMGIETDGETLCDLEAERILAERRSLRELVPFVDSIAKEMGTEVPLMRIVIEAKRILKRDGKKTILTNYETLSETKAKSDWFHEADAEAVRSAVLSAVDSDRKRREGNETETRKGKERTAERTRSSTRSLSKELEVSQPMMEASLKSYGYHPYKVGNWAFFLPEEEAEDLRKKRRGIVPWSEFLRRREREEGGRLKADVLRHREIAFLDLVDHDGYGVEVLRPESVVFGKEEKEFCYVREKDERILAERTRRFRMKFGLTETERMRRILNESKRPLTNSLLTRFMKETGIEGTETPSHAEVVRAVTSEPVEVVDLSDEDVLRLFSGLSTRAASKFLASFLQWVRSERPTKYHEVFLRKRPCGTGDGAYSFETMTAFAGMVFGEDFIRENGLVEKALRDPTFAEAWLFHATFFIDCWRAEDVASNWEYLNLDDDPNFLPEVDRKTIKRDLLADAYPDSVYEKACMHSLQAILTSRKVSHKTANWSPADLAVNVTPSLRPFFGRLLLILEHHNLTNGRGRMSPERVEQYRNRYVLRDFYGPRAKEVFGNENLHTRRLNKASLQGVEDGARKTGLGQLRAHSVAAYARSHKNLDTLKHYVGDHALYGETPEFVLWAMMERGAWGVLPYSLLMQAYPEAFGALTPSEQTEVIRLMGLSPYELEVATTGYLAASRAERSFARGNLEEPTAILKAMFLMSQNRVGLAKDNGTNCLVRAMGENCVMPEARSCIANLCPYNVFSSAGIPALLGVIDDYKRKYETTGNSKYAYALKKVLIPNWKSIRSELSALMDEDERRRFDLLVKEVSHGRSGEKSENDT